MRSKFSPTLIVFVLGSVLFIGGFFLWKNTSSSFSKDIGKIEVYNGHALLKATDSNSAQRVNKEAKFPSGSLITTLTNGDAVIEIKDTRIKLRSDTQIYVEAIPPEYVIYLQKGTLEPETTIAEDSPVMIEAGLQRLQAKKYFANLASPKPPPAPKNDNTGLAQDTIQRVLAKEQTLFYRCYIQLLQRSPKGKGEVDLVFTILGSGKVSQPSITGSQLKDETFRKCLIEVISRVTFPRFDGPPVATVFPLKFE